jgi:hypothetical protein
LQWQVKITPLKGPKKALPAVNHILSIKAAQYAAAARLGASSGDFMKNARGWRWLVSVAAFELAPPFCSVAAFMTGSVRFSPQPTWGLMNIHVTDLFSGYHANLAGVERNCLGAKLRSHKRISMAVRKFLPACQTTCSNLEHSVGLRAQVFSIPAASSNNSSLVRSCC